MSGTTRAITLTLSVRDADKVRQELERIGPAGEAAIRRLDAAARTAAGSGGAVPALATTTQQAGNRVGELRNVVGQAGFQLQDFAVQVQGGTSALTALSQQGSQFLGVFGPAGAAAGAALTVGILAAQLLGMGETAEQANKRIEEGFKANQRAGEELTRVIRELSGELLTAAERAARLANAQREVLVTEGEQQIFRLSNEQTAAVQQYTQAQQELLRVERARARLEADLAAASPRNRAGIEADLREVNATRFSAQSRFDAARSEMERTTGRISELRALTDRVREIRTGPEEFGPPAPDDRAERAAERRAAAEQRREDAQNAREFNAILSERDSLLRAIETPQEKFNRRLEELGRLQEQLTARGESLNEEQLGRIRDGLQRELDEANRRAQGVDDVGRQLGLTFTSAFEDAIVKGKDFRDVLKGIEQDIARLIIRKAITEPAANAIQGINWSGLATSIVSGLFGGSSTPTGYTYGAGGYYGAGPFTASANGNAFSGGNVIPFARGGIVTRPTMFPMANGAGLMGEAGPEAVMPLQRDNRGRLGVVAQGGGGNSISQTINIDARGADAGVDQKIRAAIAIAVRQANAQLLADINRGGSTAKQVGRRA